MTLDEYRNALEAEGITLGSEWRVTEGTDQIRCYKVTLEIWHDKGKRFPPIPFIDFADAEKWALGAKNSRHVGDGWNITIKRETQVTFS